MDAGSNPISGRNLPLSPPPTPTPTVRNTRGGLCLALGIHSCATKLAHVKDRTAAAKCCPGKIL